MHEVILFTDGGCITQHPARPGGWAAILVAVTDRMLDPMDPVIDARSGQPCVKELSGHATGTTNQQMEIEAVIQGLEHLKQGPINVLVVADSAYVITTMTVGQKRKANLDRWARLDDIVRHHDVRWQWTKAHAAGDSAFSTWNNRADALVKIERNKAAALPSNAP